MKLTAFNRKRIQTIRPYVPVSIIVVAQDTGISEESFLVRGNNLGSGINSLEKRGDVKRNRVKLLRGIFTPFQCIDDSHSPRFQKRPGLSSRDPADVNSVLKDDLRCQMQINRTINDSPSGKRTTHFTAQQWKLLANLSLQQFKPLCHIPGEVVEVGGP